MSQFPTLDPGEVTFLDTEAAPAALYRLVGDHLAGPAGADDSRDPTPGPVYWVDARNAAAPAALDDHLPAGAVDRLRVARAFTGYQHHELVRSLPGVVSRETSLLVAPNLAALYEDGDIDPDEAGTLFESTLTVLAATARAVDAPVVVTAPGARRETQVREAADRVLDAESTRAGLAVTGEAFTPDVYWHDWGFQTTIPYWVDLLAGVGTAASASVPEAPGGPESASGSRPLAETASRPGAPRPTPLRGGTEE